MMQNFAFVISHRKNNNEELMTIKFTNNTESKVSELVNTGDTDFVE